MNVTVHGTQYISVRAMEIRIKDLVWENEAIGESDGRVTEITALQQAIAERKAVEREARRPFVVLYRKAVRGEIVKGRRTFATAAEQSRWIRNAPDSVAITFTTN